jgi:RNA polymerase sigma-70 factor (ECF subfamily)
MSDGPLAGLKAIDAVVPELPNFHLVPAARGELLARSGRTAAARDELDRAIELAPSERERRQLTRRRLELEPG